MKKNTASQVIGAQMVSATDGSAFTGTVTAYVTGDAGTQAIGSVGSGVCTHEGNGFHSYAPSQAETNYDHIAFTFIGTGAVPATVQTYTTFPQTGDVFTRVGAPAGASVSADVAAIKSETAAIVADTNELQTDWVNGGRLDLILDGRASPSDVLTQLGTGTWATAIPWNASWDTEVQSEVADALTAYNVVATSNLPTNFGSLGINGSGHITRVVLVDTTTTNTDMRGTDGANTTTPPTAGAVADAVWDEVLSGHLTGGTTGAGLNAASSAGDPWATTLPGAYSAGTAGNIIGNNLDQAVSTVSAPSAEDVATEIFGTAVEGSETLRQSLRLMRAEAAGKLLVSGNTVTIRDAADSKDRITATVDSNGQRTAITVDVT